MNMIFENSSEFARRLDVKDPLRYIRNLFIIPEEEGREQIYFLGNSLGLQPKITATLLNEVLKQWGRLGVEGFFKGAKPWLVYHDELISPLSEIVGALPHEVVVMNQLTVNLHLMMTTFYQPEGMRKKIICESKAFPSDQYMLETHLKQRGLNPEEIIIEVNPREGEFNIRTEDILQTIDANKEEVTLVFWGGVNYYTGQVFDMEAITDAAHKAGATAGFDLAHAAGNVALRLHDWKVDFACWCSYKYLNSGPGAVAGTFIHERYHQADSLKRLGGWWGHNKASRFLMQKGFDPIPTAEGWQLSTPSPMLYAAHQAALQIFREAGMDKLISKGQLMSDFILFILADIEKQLDRDVLQIITPQKKEEKGCQVSLLMKRSGKEVFDFLSCNGIFADWREPDVIRIAPVPLYNTFEEIWQFGNKLLAALKAMPQDETVKKVG